MEFIFLFLSVIGLVLIMFGIRQFYGICLRIFKTWKVSRLIGLILDDAGCANAEDNFFYIENTCKKYNIDLRKANYYKTVEFLRPEVKKSIERSKAHAHAKTLTLAH